MTATGGRLLVMWLLKSDPETYGYADLERDKRTVWDGVRNPQALKYLGQMKKGDQVFVYETGDDKQIVGLAEVTKEAYPDPKQKDPKLLVIEVQAKERVPKPVTLAQVKADPAFAEFQLVRMSRLSVMPVPAAMWKKLLKMGGM